MLRSLLIFACLSYLTAAARAEDWPAWRGKRGLGIWSEMGVVEKFPDDESVREMAYLAANRDEWTL
jgi:hypothetical protein